MRPEKRFQRAQQSTETMPVISRMGRTALRRNQMRHRASSKTRQRTELVARQHDPPSTLPLFIVQDIPHRAASFTAARENI